MIKQITSLLSSDEKRSLIRIYAIMLIHAALDLIGISVVLPIITLILDSGADYSDSKVLTFLVRLTGLTEQGKLLSLTILVLVIIYFVKSCFTIFYRYTTNRFSLEYSNDLTHRLMLSYLAMPYEYHRNNSSATLMEKSFYDVDNFVRTIGELLNLMTKELTLFVILGYLLTISWSITLIVGVFLVAFATIVVIAIKPETKRISEKVQALEANNYKYLSQAYSGIKEAKIFGTERRMAYDFYKNEAKKNDLILRRNVLNSLPSSFIEFIGILGVCVALYVLERVMGLSDKTVIAEFSTLVYGVIVLLPVFISISSTFNNLSFYRKSVNDIYEDIEKAKEYEELFQPEKYVPFEFSDTIAFKNVSFAYQNSDDESVLENVNLEIKKNSIVALFGPSGGGKTTFLNLLLGLFTPTEGCIEVDGRDIAGSTVAWRKNISYIPQNIFMLDDTIEKNVAYGCTEEEIDSERLRSALKNAEIYNFVQTLPKKEKSLVGENGIRLSGGQRQRIGIARALYRNANIIVADEATSAIDYPTAHKIFENIANMEDDHTLIIATHRENSIKHADVIFEVQGASVKSLN